MVGKDQRVRRSRADDSDPLSVVLSSVGATESEENKVPLLEQVGRVYLQGNGSSSSRANEVFERDSWTMNRV